MGVNGEWAWLSYLKCFQNTNSDVMYNTNNYIFASAEVEQH